MLPVNKMEQANNEVVHAVIFTFSPNKRNRPTSYHLYPTPDFIVHYSSEKAIASGDKGPIHYKYDPFQRLVIQKL